MSTNITTAYNALLSRLSTLFPTKTRIPYAEPSNIDRNTDKYLRNGYGVWFADINSEILEFHKYTNTYSVLIHLSREMIHKDNDYGPYDDGALLLLEDMNLLVKDMNKPDQLGQNAAIEDVTVTNISSIRQIFDETSSYFYVTISLRLVISESIN